MINNKLSFHNKKWRNMRQDNREHSNIQKSIENIYKKYKVFVKSSRREKRK